MKEDRVEQLTARLKDEGGRITSSRRAILRALVDSDGHPTAEQLTAEVKATHPALHESTVYRFLDELERLDVVDHVHLGHGPGVYHFTDDVHNHLVCDLCGSVTEIPSSVIEGLQQKLINEFGFEMEPRHFAVSGCCRDCAKKPTT